MSNLKFTTRKHLSQILLEIQGCVDYFHNTRVLFDIRIRNGGLNDFSSLAELLQYYPRPCQPTENTITTGSALGSILHKHCYIHFCHNTNFGTFIILT